MSKAIQLFLFALIFVTLAMGCSKSEGQDVPNDQEMGQSEEENPNEEPEENPEISLEEERTNTIQAITSGSNKAWAFEEVILMNANGNFDISENFNTKDDVFQISTVAQNGKNPVNNSGSIEWRKENDINFNASSSAEALLESLVSSEVGAFEFAEDSGTAMISQDLGFSFELMANGKLSGEIEVGIGRTLQVVLAQKANSSIPTATLNFTDTFSFLSNGIDNQSADMIGSFVSNSLYIGLREDGVETPDGTDKPERVIRYDFSTGEVEDLINLESFTSDFVSKELVLYQNELKVVGAQRINSYDLELNNTPESSADYKNSSPFGSSTFFTRYGVAAIDNSLFIIGGYLGNDFEYADRIFKFDFETETIEDIFTLPEPSLGARSEIVGNKIYTFGGSTEFYSPEARNSIAIFDIVSQELSFSEMNRAVNFTYTGRHGDLIYVGGRVDTYNEAEELTDRDPFLGVYDTVNDEFIELSTNLSSPNQETIHAMTVFNGKIYVLFGDRGEVERPEMIEWTVLTADI